MNHDRLALYALALAILAFLVVALLVVNSALRAGTPPAAQEAPHIAALRRGMDGPSPASWTAGAASASATPGVTAPGPPPSSRAAPATRRASASARLSGWATWYRYVPGGAAAGPALRRALGAGWRGSRVTVCAARCVRVTLSDWCWCPKGNRIVDLDARSFAVLAPLGAGLVAVTVTW